MCTLIIGRDVVARGSVLLAANRDEDPARPTDPPGVLSEAPRLVGGRDRRAGGTWLAVRERRAVVAILNRRDPSNSTPNVASARRSRGILALEAALAGDVAGLPDAIIHHALAEIAEAPYAPFTMLVATAAACRLLALEHDREPVVAEVPSGWHVVTHMDLDDPREPRTTGLLAALAGLAPRTVDEAERRLEDLLRSHGDVPSGPPPVCLHQGKMVTVSASTVWLADGEARYRHAEGRPCEHAFTDLSHLLGA